MEESVKDGVVIVTSTTVAIDLHLQAVEVELLKAHAVSVWALVVVESTCRDGVEVPDSLVVRRSYNVLCRVAINSCLDVESNVELLESLSSELCLVELSASLVVVSGVNTENDEVVVRLCSKTYELILQDTLIGVSRKELSQSHTHCACLSLKLLVECSNKVLVLCELLYSLCIIEQAEILSLKIRGSNGVRYRRVSDLCNLNSKWALRLLRLWTRTWILNLGLSTSCK